MTHLPRGWRRAEVGSNSGHQAIRSEPRPPRAARGGDLPALTTELVRLGIRAAGLVERELIQQVLAFCDRIQIKAAARLGINRNTLHKKLADYKIDDTAAPSNGIPAAPPEED